MDLLKLGSKQRDLQAEAARVTTTHPRARLQLPQPALNHQTKQLKEKLQCRTSLSPPYHPPVGLKVHEIRFFAESLASIYAVAPKLYFQLHHHKNKD